MKLVLMCGGVGKKMWPQSRKTSPKHFLPLFNGKSLFQINYEVLREKYKPEDIFLQTNPEQAIIARNQCPEIVEKNCFIEPEVRDTGPALGMMIANLFLIDPDEPYFYIQADLIREPKEQYFKTIEYCESLVREDGRMITGGEKPINPVMGIDYLKVGKVFKTLNNINVYPMDEWLGRNSEESVIASFIKQDTVLMHWNHNTSTPRSMLKAFEKYKPDWYLQVNKVIEALKVGNKALADHEFSQMEKGPMEIVTKHALKEGYVIQLPYRCIDFGTWASVARYQKEINIYNPNNTVEIDSANNYIVAPENKQVAVIGLNNITVIDTQDGLLVCSNDSSGKVGEVVEKLKEQGKEEYL